MDNETVKLDRRISTKSLLGFALPTIIGTFIASVFGIVDGIFVSNIIGDKAMAAVGIVWPFFMFTLAIGFMIGVGGNALVGKQLGEGLKEEAPRNFTFLTLTAFVVSTVMTFGAYIFRTPIVRLLGADEAMVDMTIEYLTPLVFLIPFVMVGILLQQFLITQGKAEIGMIAQITGGIANVFFNWLFIAHLDMGLRGAALATGVGYSIPFIVGMAYFIFMGKRGPLYFTWFSFSGKVLLQASSNGASEMVSLMAIAIVSTVSNNVLMDMVGPIAVAAFGIVMAGQGILVALAAGYASGIAPIISFNYGANNASRLRKLFKITMVLLSVVSVAMLAVGIIFANQFVRIYVDQYSPVYGIAVTGFRIMAISFLFSCINTFASMFYTALNNGKISGTLSFLRMFVFTLGAVLILPRMFDLNGMWLSLPVAELLAFATTIFCLVRYKKRYQY